MPRMAEVERSRRMVGRSPNYPSIDLGEAIKRAEVIFRKEGRNFAPIPVIYGHWKYSPKSSGAMVTLAALTKFGLLIDQGKGESRRARVSDDAVKILVDPESSVAKALIRGAALRPTIHADLIERYRDGLPSDGTMKAYLVADRGFTPDGAGELMAEFKRTLAYSGIQVGDSLSPNGEDSEEDHEEEPPAPRDFAMTAIIPAVPQIKADTQPSEKIVIPIPLGAEGLAALQLPTRMTRAAWARMLSIIAAYEDSVVDEAARPTPTSESDPTA